MPKINPNKHISEPELYQDPYSKNAYYHSVAERVSTVIGAILIITLFVLVVIGVLR